MELPLALREHPLRRPRILMPFIVLLALVQLPFLHAWLRGAPAVTAAVPFRDDFERATLGNAYWSNGGDWRIVRGMVYSPGVGNNPLWLKARLPQNVRIEFDVRSEGTDGDVKWEAFGDGRNHSTGYVFIFGGWHNRETRLAKLDEHALTKSELQAELANQAQPYPRKYTGLEAVWEAITGPFARAAARADLKRFEKGTYYQPDTPIVVKRLDLRVERGHTYHVTITRRGGQIRWEQDGDLVLELDDPAPLPIKGHDRFGFSSWQNDTWFDNLKIEPL
ncbi:MAG TPA: hypothetical protein VG496_20465 [Myxococcales bacterium]|nr:hypothetical protein [Myxococcales bacterium]